MKRVIIINIVIYFENKSFVNSITDYINSHDVSTGIFPTDDWERAREYLKKDLKSILLCSPKCNEIVDNRIIYLVENEREDGIYLYQPCNMLIKDIEKIQQSFKEDVKVASFLVPSGFDMDFELVSSIAKRITATGRRALVVDTNPCRTIRNDIWDLKTKRIMDGNLERSDLDFYDGYYYIKPYSLYEDYYNGAVDFDTYLKRIKETGFIDSILIINHMNNKRDLSIAAELSAKKIALFYSSGHIDEKLLDDIKKSNYEILLSISGFSNYEQSQTYDFDHIIRFEDQNQLDELINSVKEAMI